MQDESAISLLEKGPTLKELAALAGVSVATVCRALNDLPGVGNSKKERIVSLAREMRYRPHEVARSLVLQKTGFVGLITSHLENPFFGSLAQELEQELKAAGYSVLLYIDNGPYEKAFQLMLSRRVDAIVAGPIIGEMDLGPILESGGALPCIFFGSARTSSNSLHIDAFNGVRQAIHYLHGRGYRRLGFVGRVNTVKVEGLRCGAQECGLSIDPRWVLDRSGTMDNGYEAVKLLLEQKERPDCVVCHNDLTAIGALKALAESGVSCPDEMAVLGYDGIDLGAFCYPPLTTVCQPVSRMTSALVGMLRDRINGQSSGGITIVPQLIVRQSA